MTKTKPGRKRIRGPDPYNIFAPYFPDDVVERCERDVKSILEHFDHQHIVRLQKELMKGRFNGSFSATDLMGTLSRITREPVEALYKRIGREPNIEGSLFEYWFRQIGGGIEYGRTPMSEMEERCLFTEITVEWCGSLLASKFIASKRSKR